MLFAQATNEGRNRLLMLFLKNISALIIGLVFAFVAGEILCRFFLPISTVCYFYDKEIGTTLAPNRHMRWTNRLDYDNWVVTNSAGFHDMEHELNKDKNTYRILVLGDSFMEALQVPISDGFSRQLEQNLRKKIQDRQIEVINLGLSGRGPAQYYRILEKKGLPYDPDLVVMAILPDNDFTDSYKKFSNSSYKPYYRIDTSGEVEMIPFSVPPWYSIKSLLTRSSMAYFFAYEILKRPAVARVFMKVGLLPSMNVEDGKIKTAGRSELPLSYGLFCENPDVDWQKAYEITLRMVRETRDLAKENGSDFIAFAIPNTLRVEGKTQEILQGENSVSLNFDRPFQVLARYCEKWRISFVDLTPFFREDYQRKKTSHSWAHDGHWNKRGHQLGAEIMAMPIAEKIIQKQKN